MTYTRISINIKTQSLYNEIELPEVIKNLNKEKQLQMFV